MAFILSAAALIVAVYVSRKIGGIEQRLEQIEHKRLFTLTPSNGQKPAAPPPPPPDSKSALTQEKYIEQGPSWFEDLVEWVKADWPLKAGALLIVLGFVWLVTYAFLNNWIGPAGRITLGLVAGSLVMAFGNQWFTRSRKQGHVLVALGASVMLVSIYAAQFKYEMFHPTVALSLTALIMALSAAVSVKHDSRALAVISLIIGGLAPVLTNAPEPSIVGLYSYLLMLCVGVLWLTQYKRWQFLTPLALILVSLYSGQYFFRDVESLRYSMRALEILQLKFFAITFTTLFFGASLAGTIRNEKIKPALGTALLVGAFALGWINGIVQPHNQGLVTMIAAVAFAVGAYMNYSRTNVKEAVYVYTAIASILLAVATGYQFDGPVLTIMFATQAAILSIFAHRFLTKHLGYSLVLYQILPILSSIDSWESGKWNCLTSQQIINSFSPTTLYRVTAEPCRVIFHADFFALLLVTASLLITGYYFYQLKKSEEETTRDMSHHNAGVILIVLGAVYSLALVWRTLTAGMVNDDSARMIALILYTIVGLGVYINGQINHRRVRYWFGLILLLLVIGRLLIIEVWDMALAGRIVMFFLIGLLLMGSVLLRKAK